MLLEASAHVGGLARTNPFEDHWIVVLPDVTGHDVARNIRRSLTEAAVDLRANLRADTVRRTHGGFEIEAVGGVAVASANVVIASGARLGYLVCCTPTVTKVYWWGRASRSLARTLLASRWPFWAAATTRWETTATCASAGPERAHIYARSLHVQAQWLNRVRTVDLHVGHYVVEPASRRVNGCRYDFILVFYG